MVLTLGNERVRVMGGGCREALPGIWRNRLRSYGETFLGRVEFVLASFSCAGSMFDRCDDRCGDVDRGFGVDRGEMEDSWSSLPG